MTTDDLLNLDCTVKTNKNKLNKFLWKVKPLKKQMEREGHEMYADVPTSVLEIVLHGLSIRYGFRNQGITEYYEDNKFVFYTCSMIRKADTSVWIGNVYGKTLWEITAKMIIKVYAEIMAEKKGVNKHEQ